jgi:hypothetical protein
VDALIVSIKPLPKEAFIYEYGMAPKDLADLAREGFVIPDLYAYGSDSRDEGGQRERFSDHLSHLDTIGHFLEQDVPTRALHYAREGFLSHYARDKTSSFKEEADRVLPPEGLFRQLTEGERRSLAKSEDAAGARFRTLARWAYLRTFAENCASIQDELNVFLKEGLKTKEHLVDALKFLQGWRGVFVAPRTACFDSVFFVDPERLREVDRFTDVLGIPEMQDAHGAVLLLAPPSSPQTAVSPKQLHWQQSRVHDHRSLESFLAMIRSIDAENVFYHFGIAGYSYAVSKNSVGELRPIGFGPLVDAVYQRQAVQFRSISPHWSGQ